MCVFVCLCQKTERMGAGQGTAQVLFVVPDHRRELG